MLESEFASLKSIFYQIVVLKSLKLDWSNKLHDHGENDNAFK